MPAASRLGENHFPTAKTTVTEKYGTLSLNLPKTLAGFFSILLAAPVDWPMDSAVTEMAWKHGDVSSPTVL